MSTCSNFTPAALRKNRCGKCSRSKDDHSADSTSKTSEKHISSDDLHVFTSQEAIVAPHSIEVMKVKVSGRSCSSSFYVIYEVQPNNTIQDLIAKIEQTIPCTKVTDIIYNRRELDKRKSFTDYHISNGSIIHVKTDTEGHGSLRVACMGCSYHNIIRLSANIARGLNIRANLNPEAVKTSIHQCLDMLDINDQIKIRQFLNYVTELSTVRLMVCVRDMLKDYIRIYRNVEYANIIEFDYTELLNELRCPICFSRFSLQSYSANTAVQLCTLSDKHYVCQKCFPKMNQCPLCNGNIRSEIIDSKYISNLRQTSMEKIEAYCFPTTLNDIDIKADQQPFAHGAFCNIFRVKNYAIKCPRVPASTGSDIEHTIVHEIFLSRPLSHIPNILVVYGGMRLRNYGVSIVMEYVDGPSLAAALEDGKILNLSFDKRLDIALGICKGLGELHLAGIIHRDFKPANVLLERTPMGSGFIPKIADFGVSFLIQTASATAVKKSGGTVGYDAPEVADGEIPSIQSDIYALAFTLYELLTVQRPFFGLKDTQIITRFTLKGDRPKDWTIQSVDKSATVFPEFLKNTIEKGWSTAPEDRARIGEITYAVRKSININYVSCVEKMLQFHRASSHSSSYDFMNRFDDLELLAIQAFLKRTAIEDSEAIDLLLNNYAWG